MVGGPQTTIVHMNPVHHLRASGASFRGRRWLPGGSLARQSHGPLLGGLGLRFRTWREAEELDEQLAAGADPLGSDELSLRAGQLRSGKTRSRIARSLLAALDIADLEIPAALNLSVHRPEVRNCRELIVELAERLRDDDHMEVRGLALARHLATADSSALYDPHAGYPLSGALQVTLLALDSWPADTRDSA
jgi:hypothetical protein